MNTLTASEYPKTIAQVAEQFGLTLRALRFYEQRGLLAPDRVRRERQYTEYDVRRVAVIVKAKCMGFAVDDIKELISDDADGNPRLSIGALRLKEQTAIMKGRLIEVTEGLGDLLLYTPVHP